MQRRTVRQKDASKIEGEGIQNSDQVGNAICGGNLGYNEATLQEKRIEVNNMSPDAMVDARSDTQQDQELTHPREK